MSTKYPVFQTKRIFLSVLVVVSMATSMFAQFDDEPPTPKLSRSRSRKLSRTLSTRFSIKRTPLPFSISAPEALNIPQHIDLNPLYPLHKAAQENQCIELYYLLRDGKNIDHRNERDETPLHHAAHVGYKNAVDTLAMNNADIDAQDVNGHTPLHKALLRYQTARNIKDQKTYKEIIMALILKYRASITVQSNQGQTARQLMKISKRSPISPDVIDIALRKIIQNRRYSI